MFIGIGYKRRNILVVLDAIKTLFPAHHGAVTYLRESDSKNEVVAVEMFDDDALIGHHVQKPAFILVSGVSGIVESGFVHLHAGAPWLDEFLLEVTRFPNAKHDDQVDAFSQALHYLVEAQRLNSFFG